MGAVRRPGRSAHGGSAPRRPPTTSPYPCPFQVLTTTSYGPAKGVKALQARRLAVDCLPPTVRAGGGCRTHNWSPRPVDPQAGRRREGREEEGGPLPDSPQLTPSRTGRC